MTHDSATRFTRTLLSAALAAAVLPAGFAAAQTLNPVVVADALLSSATPSDSATSSSSPANTLPDALPDTLPDAPSTLLLATAAPSSADASQDAGPNAAPRVAPLYTKYIPAGWTAQPITARDKVILGLRDLYSPLSLMGDTLSAGYSDLVNGQPNYGVNRTAFGQRVGATFLRDSTEGIFTDTVFAPLLHEDPRFFVEGPQHNFFHRLVYAATRPVLTRTDEGHSSLNGAELFGYAAASGLSYTYYPPINRNFHDTAATFGGGLGGSAIGDVVSEFADQVLQAVHLEKRQ